MDTTHQFLTIEQVLSWDEAQLEQIARSRSPQRKADRERVILLLRQLQQPEHRAALNRFIAALNHYYNEMIAIEEMISGDDPSDDPATESCAPPLPGPTSLAASPANPGTTPASHG